MYPQAPHVDSRIIAGVYLHFVLIIALLPVVLVFSARMCGDTISTVQTHFQGHSLLFDFFFVLLILIVDYDVLSLVSELTFIIMGCALHSSELDR